MQRLNKKTGDNRYPAIAIIEFNSIAAGITAGDVMLKKAPLDMVKAGTVHPGKYLVLIGGDMASVEESYCAGLSVRPETIVDNVILPDVHIEVHDCLLGKKAKIEYEALSILETSTVASNVMAADAAVKGADINIREIRLADGLGGNAFTLFAGKVEDVEAAIEIGTNTIKDKEIKIYTSVIPNLDRDMSAEIDLNSRFYEKGE